MTETRQMLFARNLMCVCVDGNESEDYQGLIWNQYSDDPTEFSSVNSMLAHMDELMDAWEFPQRALEQRYFNKHDSDPKPEYEPGTGELAIDKIQAANGTRNIQNKSGKLGTFVVQVSFRQNATWQGSFVFAEKNEKHKFMSAIEFIRLMGKCLKN